MRRRCQELNTNIHMRMRVDANLQLTTSSYFFSFLLQKKKEFALLGIFAIERCSKKSDEYVNAKNLLLFWTQEREELKEEANKKHTFLGSLLVGLRVAVVLVGCLAFFFLHIFFDILKDKRDVQEKSL